MVVAVLLSIVLAGVVEKVARGVYFVSQYARNDWRQTFFFVVLIFPHLCVAGLHSPRLLVVPCRPSWFFCSVDAAGADGCGSDCRDGFGCDGPWFDFV